MNRTVISVLGAFLILGAFSLVCAWSALSLSSAPQLKVHRLTTPLFEQPWFVAGNDFPTSILQLEFRTLGRNQWDEWRDATASFSHDEASPMERLEQFINEELRWQITHNLYSENSRPEFRRIKESSAYAKALHYALSMNYHGGNPLPDSVQLRMAIHFVPPPDQAHTQQISYLNFPPYAPVQ
jgi:hypothetical protein